jgi:two-component system chemotaxis response regulator CheY
MKKGPVILIVDDNMNFVDRMISLLQETDLPRQIFSANNYNEARRMLEEVSPDIILLDINLPGKSGIEILKWIRLTNISAVILMLTNHADAYYRQQCMDLGADYFLDKSEDFGLVPAIINKLSMKV